MRKQFVFACVLTAMLLSGCVANESSGSPKEFSAELQTETIGTEKEKGQHSESPAHSGEITVSTAEYPMEPVSYDLTGLPAMKNKFYAETDSGIVFRQYSDEDFSKGGLWGNLTPVEHTEKELMCMETDGSIICLGTDYGCGTLLFSEGRLFSQEYHAEGGYQVYSCALDGSDVIYYDAVQVLNLVWGSSVVCSTTEGGIAVIDASTGEERVVWDSDVTYLGASDEVLYFYGYADEDEEGLSALHLYTADAAVDVKVILSITPEQYWTDRGVKEDEGFVYPRAIPCFQILGDEIYFSLGEYQGSGQMYTGGPIYRMKADGSDCEAVAYSGMQYFYLYENSGNRCLYYMDYELKRSGEEMSPMRPAVLKGSVPEDIILPEPYASFEKPYVDGGTDSVWFYPDNSGVCYVLLTMEESDALGIETHVDGLQNHTVSEIEYVGDRLIFTVRKLYYNKGECIGWRDYYDRGESKVYCKDLKTGEITLLYQY